MLVQNISSNLVDVLGNAFWVYYNTLICISYITLLYMLRKKECPGQQQFLKWKFSSEKKNGVHDFMCATSSQPTSKVGSHHLHYCEAIFFHLSQFMVTLTFEQCLSFWLLFKLAKKSRGKFSCSSYKAFFIFWIIETGSHLSFKACVFSCINQISIYEKQSPVIPWQRELLCFSGQEDEYNTQTFLHFLKSPLSLQCKVYLFITAFYLFNVFEINSGM